MTGREERLSQPRIGGWPESDAVASHHPFHLADTEQEIDCLIPLSPDFDPDRATAEGQQDLANRLLEEFGRELYPIRHVSAPLLATYELWGFEGMMTMIAERPGLVVHASRRLLEQRRQTIRRAVFLGAEALWIEDCLTDLISPKAFASLHLPFLQQLVEATRDAGLKSIHYFCGDPSGKWDYLLSAGADALALEESKKGFVIDIEEAVARVAGRCTVLGNLDALGVLQEGTPEQLRAEIARQIAAGRRNGSRFIMSLGSPVTPDTPVERVRLYCDLVHELGRG